MSIGQNAIKRVENNGYSHVETSAPDMENSTVEEAVPVKSPSGRKRGSAKPAAAPASQTERNGFERYSFGQALPYWLL